MQIKRDDNYQNDKSIIAEIQNLISPSYKEAGLHITKDIALCPILYTINSFDGKMLAFFMVGYYNIGGIDCCYLGLSACREENKKQGFIKRLYLEFARDCAIRELQLNKRILCYWTTATPIIYYWFNKYFTCTQPDFLGNCTTDSIQLISIIAKSHYTDVAFNMEYPFILRQAAHHVNYSDEEKQRLQKAKIDLGLTVFDKFHLDETKGDHFLMIGYTLSHEKIINITQ